LKSELQRHQDLLFWVVFGWALHEPIYGAYTELYAGLSPDVKLADSGKYIIPWGRFGYLPAQIDSGLKTKAEGGSGYAEDFWNYCEAQSKDFA
jgi:retinol dehydrogenase-12